MKLSKTKQAVIALVIANTIWGAAPPIFKWSMQGIDPFVLGFLRFFLAALILFPFALNHLAIEKKDIGKLITLSLVGFSINISLYLWGLTQASSINAPIIGSSAPIFLIISAIIFLHEKPKPKVILGTCISLIGVLVVILQPVFDKGIDGSITGNLLLAIATVTSVVYTILLKEIVKKYRVIPVTFWSFLIGSLGFLPFVFYQTIQPNFSLNPNIHAIIGVAFGTILSSIVAYLLYTYSLKYLVACEVGIFVYLDPIVAVLIAIPLLGEKITEFFLVGSILVFLGIFISEGRLHYHPLHLIRQLADEPGKNTSN